MTDFYCKHCPQQRFIGTGSGSGQIRLQCKKCGRWQLVTLQADTDQQPRVAQRLTRV